LQIEAYGKEQHIPARLFDILKKQRTDLMTLNEKFGPIVTPEQLLKG
jgi:phosphoenolpyruvate carboxykinase (GTP)